MSKVRVLVGTRKGAFVLTADGKRKNWDVSGPYFGGWEMYHLKGSPAVYRFIRHALDDQLRAGRPGLNQWLAGIFFSEALG